MNATTNGKTAKGMRGFDFGRMCEVLALVIVTPAIVHAFASLQNLPVV